MKTMRIIALSVGMAGCISNQAIEEALVPARSIGPSVVCDSGCKVEWQRAQLWLARHSVMKIQTATDVLLQTYNTDATDNSGYSFSVTKEPTDGSRYRVSIEIACHTGKWTGCDPKPDDVRDAFVYYVKTGKDLLDEKVDSRHDIR
jgi:hypothetical protein